ncbi:MAG: hypothetical protein ACRD2W_20745, partial [Acidimicrobiales bacterium]
MQDGVERFGRDQLLAGARAGRHHGQRVARTGRQRVVDLAAGQGRTPEEGERRLIVGRPPRPRAPRAPPSAISTAGGG